MCACTCSLRKNVDNDSWGVLRKPAQARPHNIQGHQLGLADQGCGLPWQTSWAAPCGCRKKQAAAGSHCTDQGRQLSTGTHMRPRGAGALCPAPASASASGRHAHVQGEWG
jgi:hypothetical protein